MPTVLRVGAFRFFFYSNEGVPRKDPHIHVRGAGGEAKISLVPPCDIIESIGYSSHTLRTVAQIVLEHREALVRSYNEYFSQPGMV